MKNKIFKVLIIAILSANVVYAESSRKIRISNVPMSKIEEDYKKLGDREDLFIKDKNGVYKYSYGDTAQKLNGIDPKTVEVFNKFYLKDKNGVYYLDKNKIKILNLEGMDLKTLEVVDNSYLKDKNSVYLVQENKLKRLEKIDPNTFETMISFFGFKDKNGYYVLDRDGSVVKINDKEVKIKNLAKSSFNSNFFYDGKNLYFIKNHKFERIKKAPKTDGISEISDRYVEIGKVYYLDYDKGELIKLEKNDGRGVFFALGEDYGKDFNLNAEGVETTRRYIYFKGRILKNADYDSFGIKYNDQKNVFEIRDKNRVYETLKNE